MEIDSVPEETLKQKAETLKALATGPLASSISKLSGSSRGIPSDKDFHFFCNFDEFKVPMKEIAEKSESLLKSIGSSSFLWGKEMIFPQDSEEAYDWLVNVSDEVIERCDVSMDEFHRMRQKEEDGGKRISSIISEDGFELVSGKKKKAGSSSLENVKGDDSSPVTSVKVASRDKKTTGTRPRVPFHIPSIVRPQDQYKIMVNNSNQPFEHVWLKRSEDGSRFIHPLEELSVYDFVDRNIGNVESVKPLPIESTPFKLIEEVKDLKELAAKLQNVDEFAVDLEHNQYRSFQGMTCLMQISTRSEDYVVDTLKLRVLIGPHLRELFKDPLKKKVMHGADRDIVWLQRDFGIYICNLFDTGQASRVLQLERNSLEYLLHHFCGVTANKEYQNADWRLRPIPDEMLRYAREDTHYLLHIYDLMRARLLSAQADSESGDDLLSEVYRRSYDICMQLYEKELLTDTSYLHVYGLGGANFNAQQLAIVAGLCEWRDVVARAEDESTGYILPNKAVLEIARQMPLNAGKLRRLVRSKHPYVERNLSSVLNIIENSIQNAASFETAAEQLKKGQLERASDENVEVIAVESDALPTMAIPTRMLAAAAETMNTNGDYDDSVNGKIGECIRVPVKEETLAIVGNAFESDTSRKGGSFELPCEAGKIKNEQDYVLELPKGSPALSAQLGDTNIEMGSKTSAKTATGATVQMLKKPSRAFGALLGSSTSTRKLNPDKKVEHADPVHDRVALVGDHVNSNGGLHENVNDLGQKKSFVAAVGRKTLPNGEALPDPVKGVDITRLQISQIAYEEQVQKHIFALIGRLNLHSLSLQTVRHFALSSWRLQKRVDVIPLGKGFVLFRFGSEADMLGVWKQGPFKIDGQVLHFQRWRPDFNVHMQKNTHKLVWIRFPGLPVEYWHEAILLSLAKVAGRPFAIDKRTQGSIFWHFPRVCVEIDDSIPRVEEVIVEREQSGCSDLYQFKQQIVYEEQQKRCGICEKFGHTVEECRIISIALGSDPLVSGVKHNKNVQNRAAAAANGRSGDGLPYAGRVPLHTDIRGREPSSSGKDTLVPLVHESEQMRVPSFGHGSASDGYVAKCDDNCGASYHGDEMQSSVKLNEENRSVDDIHNDVQGFEGFPVVDGRDGFATI